MSGITVASGREPSQAKGAPDGGSSIDVADFLDQGDWTREQKLVVFMAAMAIVMDGFDGQLIGYAVPTLIKEWGVSRAAFAPVIAVGLIGMAIGSSIAGAIGDRVGRKRATVLSILVIGLATMANAVADGTASLAVFRFLTGLGVGGALPSATVLAAEFSPRRLRTMAVTLTIVCVPVGGILAGLFSATFLASMGWRWMFLVGGAASIVLAGVLHLGLAESPAWLASSPTRLAALRKTLNRIGRPLPDAVTLYGPRSDPGRGSMTGLGEIFADGLALSTVCLWAAMFSVLLSVYTAFSWLPTMLTNEGFSSAVAGAGLTAYNLGGVIGGVGCAWAVMRFGSRAPLVLFCLGGAGSAVGLIAIPGAAIAVLIAGLGLHGLFVTSVQCLLYSLAANTYPTHVRARGTAMALAVGRLGAITSAFLGAQVINIGGAFAYFISLAAAMIVAALALAVFPKHLPPVRAVRA